MIQRGGNPLQVIRPSILSWWHIIKNQKNNPMSNPIKPSLYQPKELRWALISGTLCTLIALGMSVAQQYYTSHFYIDNVQFGIDQPHFESVRQHLSSGSPSFYWHLFFILDLFFLLSIAIALKLWIDKTLREPWFIGLLVLSVIADWTEGYCYLFGAEGIGKLSAYIEDIKIIFISLLVINLLIQLAKKAKNQLRNLLQFFVASSLSLLCLAIIAFGLTFMDQCAALVVDLFETSNLWVRGLNLMLLFLCINLLTQVVSHFPIYIEFLLNNRKAVDQWNYRRWFGPIATITYINTSEKTTFKKFNRYLLGILTFLAFFYLINHSFSIYFVSPIGTGPISFCIFLPFFIHFYLLWNGYKASKNEDERTKYGLQKWYVRKYLSWLKATMVCFIVWLVIALYCGWSVFSYYATCLLILYNMYTFWYFKLVRTKLVHHLTGGEVQEWIQEYDFTWQYFYKPLQTLNKRDFLAVPLSKLSSNARYLQVLGFCFGLLAIIYLIFVLCPAYPYTKFMNAINIILMALILAYYAIVVLIKNILVLKKNGAKNPPVQVRQALKLIKEQKPVKNILFVGMINLILGDKKEHLDFSKILRFTTNGLLLLLVALVVFSVLPIGDSIHKLEEISAKDDLTIDEFFDTLSKQDQLPHIQISSFGGGLKANLWNLLVLKKLNKNMDETLMEKTLSMSGVSGGAVGLANYVLIHRLEEDLASEDIDQLIENIGLQNVVAFDIAGILGHDVLWDNILEEKTDDRSSAGMKTYPSLIEKHYNLRKDSLRNIGYRRMYKKLFEEDYLPPLFINSTSIKTMPGLVTPFVSEQVQSHFPGYKIINDKAKLDLSYYDAVSTSNRFPIMSPPAEIEDRGYFLDGGYFENSGLWVTELFAESLKKDTCYPKSTTINIINSEGDYIYNFVQKCPELDGLLGDLKDSDNIKSVVQGVTDISKLPNVLIKKYEQEETFIKVMLPHLVSIPRIEQVLGREVYLSPPLLTKIAEHNQKILKCLDSYEPYKKHYAVVEPALSRTLSRPAVHYQQAMIQDSCACDVLIQTNGL